MAGAMARVYLIGGIFAKALVGELGSAHEGARRGAGCMSSQRVSCIHSKSKSVVSVVTMYVRVQCKCPANTAPGCFEYRLFFIKDPPRCKT